jgi:hypothetical protein
MVHDAPRQRVLLFGGALGNTEFRDTWQYTAPVDRFATGMTGGDRLRCLSYPAAGQPVTFEFPSPYGFGWLAVFPEPAPTAGLVVGPPLICGTNAAFYGVPANVAQASGSPARLSFVLPPALVGLGFVAQGITFAPTLCLRVTDPLAVTIQAP